MRPAGRALAALVAVGAVGVGGVLLGSAVVDGVRPARCEFRVADRVETFSPEQSANAATIAMVSVERGLPSRAATIALATAIQESKLRNLDYGHADSLGLFQQRPSQGWGTQEQVTDPVYASNAFYDALVQVPGWQEGVITEVAQEVQRSAYPDAYADHEWEGRVLASVLTGQVSAGMGCRLAEPDARGSAQEVLDKAGRTFGGVGTMDGDTAVVQAGDPTTAWAVASWAVAHAEAERIVQVGVGDRVWDRSQDPLRWVTDTAGDTGSWDVRITVA